MKKVLFEFILLIIFAMIIGYCLGYNTQKEKLNIRNKEYNELLIKYNTIKINYQDFMMERKLEVKDYE